MAATPQRRGAASRSLGYRIQDVNDQRIGTLVFIQSEV